MTLNDFEALINPTDPIETGDCFCQNGNLGTCHPCAYFQTMHEQEMAKYGQELVAFVRQMNHHAKHIKSGGYLNVPDFLKQVSHVYDRD